MSFSSSISKSPVLSGGRSRSPVLSGGRTKSPSSSSHQNGDSADGIFSSRSRGASTGSYGTPKGKHKGKGHEPPPPGVADQSNENFFDFTVNDSVDIWGEKFTNTLRRQTLLLNDPKFEATPFIPDVNVETIGGAFVEEERMPTLKRRRGAVGPATSGLDPSSSLTPIRFRTQSEIPSTSTSPTSPNRSLGSLDYDKLKKLEREIEDLKIARWKKPLIPDTINRLLVGQSCSLEWYKSLEEKRALLDAAVATNDGNCITAVLLFLKRTVDEIILLGILMNNRHIATKHYVAFLKQFRYYKELATFYRRINDYESLGYFKLEQCQLEETPAARIEAIKACNILFKNGQLALDQPHVEEYVKLTDKQKRIEESDGHGDATVLRANSVLFQPLTTTLLYCCRFHRDEPESRTANPEAFKKLFNVSEKQYFQVYLLALCITHDWSGVETLVTSKGVFGFGKKKKKSPIGFERVVKLLGSDKYRAPDIIIAKYLNEVEDFETRLQLATDVQLFDIGLECLKQLRDRERLNSYINCIPPSKQREFRNKIKNLASNSQIKWK